MSTNPSENRTQKLAKAQQNFDQLVHAAHESVSVQLYGLEYLKARMEYELVQEVIMDLAYDAELGFLSRKESELYEIISSSWALTHLEIHQANEKMENIVDSMYKLNNEQIAMFQSRLRDKLTQRLNIFSESVESRIEHLEMEKLDAIKKLRKVETEFLETISSIYKLAHQLFNEIRDKTQSKVNLHTATVIVEQAESLLAQTINVWFSIRREARRPSATREYLCKTKNELEIHLMQLKIDVERLENTISTYRNQDAKYYEIVRRYKECQDQLSVRCNLIDQQSDSHTPDPKRKMRRSLSLNFLPAQ